MREKERDKTNKKPFKVEKLHETGINPLAMCFYYLSIHFFRSFFTMSFVYVIFINKFIFWRNSKTDDNMTNTLILPR